MLLWEVYLYHISTFTYTSVHIHLYITTFDLSLGKLCIQYTSYGIFAHTFKLYIPFCVLTEKSHLIIDSKA